MYLSVHAWVWVGTWASVTRVCCNAELLLTAFLSNLELVGQQGNVELRILYRPTNLNCHAQEITELRKNIELNATRDYEEIVGRLRSEEAAKLSLLQQQIDAHTATVSRIEQIENTLLVHGRATAAQPTSSPEYLRLYPDIQQLLRETVPLVS